MLVEPPQKLKNRAGHGGESRIEAPENNLALEEALYRGRPEGAPPRSFQ